MNSNRPVELSQKIDYLTQKISKVHSQVRKTDDLQLRLNFQQFIDAAIRDIISLRDTTASHAQTPRKGNQSQYMTPNAFTTNYQSGNVNDSRGKIYNTETEKLEYEKKMVQLQMKELENRQVQMENQTTKIRLQNKQKQLEKLEQEKLQLKKKHAEELKRLSDRNRFVEQQCQKLIKLNKAQDEQIRIVKQQRNRAQKKQMQIQKKYDDQIGKLQKFGQKNARYLDRNTQGLKCTRIYTNTTTPSSTNPQSQPRLLVLKLPTTIEVNKLVYGIMIGVQADKQVLYYEKVQLYEKEPTRVEVEDGLLVLSYKRRKENVRVVLDKYKIRVPEVVIMLYGRGDSINVYDQVTNGVYAG